MQRNLERTETANRLQYNARIHQYEFKIGYRTEFFTEREYEVLKNIQLRLSAKQIAFRLSISPRTVECHTESIKNKLQCHYKSHIIETAMRYGIIE